MGRAAAVAVSGNKNGRGREAEDKSGSEEEAVPGLTKALVSAFTIVFASTVDMAGELGRARDRVARTMPLLISGLPFVPEECWS
jgi:hypothetical protein